MVVSIEKKILGISRRRHHGAQISSQGLQNDNPRHIPLQPFTDNQSQGHKGDEGHVVGDEHAGHIGHAH